MAKKTGNGKPHTISQPAPLPQPAPECDLRDYVPDLHDWPQSWMGFPQDLVPGYRLVESFKPFLQHLIALQVSRKTLRKHMNNLWVLGGEIVRHLNETPSLRKTPVERLLLDLLADDGPLPYHCDSEDELRSFQSTCRKFRRFLEQPPS